MFCDPCAVVIDKPFNLLDLQQVSVILSCYFEDFLSTRLITPTFDITLSKRKPQNQTNNRTVNQLNVQLRNKTQRGEMPRVSRGISQKEVATL